MSVRRQTANRLTLFRTCGTCGKQIVTTADTPWVRQVERDGKRQATTYFCSEGCFAASYKHIGWFDGKAEERRKLKDRNRDPEKERARNRAYQQAHREELREKARLRRLAHPMMFLRGQGFGPARRCTKRKEAREMGLTAADLQRMGPEAQRQVMEKLGIVGKTKAPKYHNQPDSRGNLRFDSKKEARRYDELMLMLKAGQIRNLRLQQQYTLQESYITETGERVRAIHYVADFAYERPTAPDKYGTVFWLPVVEDVKSRATKTAQYEMKKKLLRERFNLTITEV